MWMEPYALVRVLGVAVAPGATAGANHVRRAWVCQIRGVGALLA
jgi:hypothetical protein